MDEPNARPERNDRLDAPATPQGTLSTDWPPVWVRCLQLGTRRSGAVRVQITDRDVHADHADTEIVVADEAGATTASAATTVGCSAPASGTSTLVVTRMHGSNAVAAAAVANKAADAANQATEHRRIRFTGKKLQRLVTPSEA